MADGTRPLTAEIRNLRAVARRCSTSPEEAEDLVQAALLASLEAGVQMEHTAWLAGVVRRLGAFAARTAGRRRAREAAFVALNPACDVEERVVPDPDGLSPALARVARLVGGGCTREELAWLLRIRDEALRQRLTALRRVVKPAPAPALGPVAPGPARRALLAHPGLPTALLGTQDPDGHLFLLGVLTTGAGADRPGGPPALGAVRPGSAP